MKLFKDTNNEVFAYELDGSQDSLIGDKTSITQEEADVINQAKIDALPKPVPTAEQEAQAIAKASALAKLAKLGLTQDEVKALVG
jgi:hypothetical protein